MIWLGLVLAAFVGISVAETVRSAATLALIKAVQDEVWKRDQGRCVKCGTQHQLEFDYIIPASRGGIATAWNQRLMCKECRASRKLDD